MSRKTCTTNDFFFFMWNLHFEDNFLQIFLWWTELLFFNIWILLFVIMSTVEHVGRFRSSETASQTWTLTFSSSLLHDVLPSSFYKIAFLKWLFFFCFPYSRITKEKWIYVVTGLQQGTSHISIYCNWPEYNYSSCCSFHHWVYVTCTMNCSGSNSGD